MEKKYELTNETISYMGKKLHRIKAVRDFSDVKKGDLGGFVEKEENLSHEGDCWVYDNAKVYDNAMVFRNAKICDEAEVFECAKIFWNAKVYEQAFVRDNVKVYGNAQVFGKSVLHGYSSVFDHAKVHDATIKEYAFVAGNADVFDADLCGFAAIFGNAVVSGHVDGYAEIKGNAVVKEMGDYMVFQNTWSSGRWFTWTRSNNMWKVGCFYGTGEELIKRAYNDSKDCGKRYEAYVKFVENFVKIG